MKEIEFSLAGKKLVVHLEFIGVMELSYRIKLGKLNSNEEVFSSDGDNLNPEDDDYDLPGKASAQDGRLLRLRSEFNPLDRKNYPDYEIKIVIKQDGKEIGEYKESGKLTGKTQTSLLFVKLVGV